MSERLKFPLGDMEIRRCYKGVREDVGEDVGENENQKMKIAIGLAQIFPHGETNLTLIVAWEWSQEIVKIWEDAMPWSIFKKNIFEKKNKGWTEN